MFHSATGSGLIMLRELTICAVLGTLFEATCVAGFIFALLIVGAILWL